jgi:hypothetical protein
MPAYKCHVPPCQDHPFTLPVMTPPRDAPACRHRNHYGHLKEDHRMGRNYLTGRDGGRINAVLAAAG